MTIPVTLNLPEDVYRRAERFARLANLDIQTVLTDTLIKALSPISAEIDTLPLEDAQIITLTQLEEGDRS